MSEDPWNDIRRKFSDDLNELIRKDDEHLKFSACPDPEKPSDGLCDIAKILCAPVIWLKNQVPGIQWLNIVQYDHHPDREHSQTHAAHLNFYVNENLESTFAEEKDKMFLMTGIACGLKDYVPLSIGGVGFTFPKFVLRKGKGNDRLPDYYGDYIEVLISATTTQCECCAQDSICTNCDKANVELEINVQLLTNKEIVSKYVNSIPGIYERLPRANTTYFNFNKKYPVTAIKDSDTQCIFIPVVHMPKLPYYVNGVMVMHSNSLEQDELDIIEDWAEDICRPLAGYGAIKHAIYKGYYQLAGSGEALRKYIEDRKSTHNVYRQDTWKGTSGKNEPTELHDLLTPANRASMKLSASDIPIPADFQGDLARYIQSFTYLGFTETESQYAAWDCMTLAGRSNNMHLFFWLAFCLEAGVECDLPERETLCAMLDKEAKLLSSGWTDQHSPLALHDVMKWLILYPLEKRSDGGKSKIVVQVLGGHVVFEHAILLKFSGGDATKKFDISNTDVSQHELTWVIRSGVALGSKKLSANISHPILALINGEVDDIYNKSPSESLAHYSLISDGVWVCLGKKSCFVLIKRTFNILIPDASAASLQ